MRTFGEGCYYIEGWRRKVLEKFGGSLRRKVLSEEEEKEEKEEKDKPLFHRSCIAS